MRMTESTPWNRSSIGFERLFKATENPAKGGHANSYPPCDIEKTGTTAYRITLAVAGFSADELTITSRSHLLTVSGRKAAKTDSRYLYHGIAARSFRRQFHLAENVRVAGAVLSRGMLIIELIQDVPGAAKQRPIEIANGNRTRVDGQIAA
jgi:molecular chaperone IbpA